MVDQSSPIVIPEQWSSAAAAVTTASLSDRSSSPPVVFICGAKNSGKSTFSRLLLKSLVGSYGKVVYLDMGVGQLEFTTPGCLSFHLIHEQNPVLYFVTHLFECVDAFHRTCQLMLYHCTPFRHNRLRGQGSHCGQLERKMLLGVMETSSSYCQKDMSHFSEGRKASADLEGISKFETMEKHFRSGSLSFDCFKFALLFGLLSFQGCQWALAGESQSLIGTDYGIGVRSFVGDLGDISTGFASAFLLIFFSELGDKTFFIAALLAARNSGAVVFLGTFGALAAMTIVSVALGRTFHYIDGILPFSLGGADLPIDDIAAVCLLTYFGVSTLLDAASTEGLKAEEEQKEAELAVSELLGNGAGIVAAASTVVSTFLLVFVAEWGDKSFFSTIALAAASSPLGVIGGALAGHAVATMIAVLGGSLLGTFFSERVIAYIGGSLFLVFAALTLIEIIY